MPLLHGSASNPQSLIVAAPVAFTDRNKTVCVEQAVGPFSGSTAFPLRRTGKETEASSTLRRSFLPIWSEILRSVLGSDFATARSPMQPNARREMKSESMNGPNSHSLFLPSCGSMFGVAGDSRLPCLTAWGLISLVSLQI